ncbi:acyl-CoA thioesterase [Novosphingobium tardum]|uniref:Acyl-CoA thioesterase n=1 Tax=Novosphingobium tardum TaxID=1538021 RepID=A0ABV8RRX9_9SPHN
MSFPAILAAASKTATGFDAHVPEDWLQGRTAYGGLSAALALESARTIADGLPPMRSAQVSFVGPLSGDVSVSSRILRQGRNATWVSSEVQSEGKVGLAATFVFMGPMESELHLNDAGAPDDTIAVDDAVIIPSDKGPGFISNFDLRHSLPRADERQPQMNRWARVRDRSGLDPMVELVLIADAMPPGVMPLFDSWRPISSMTWLINLLTPAPVTTDGWWQLRARGTYAEKGCSSQDMSVWNAAGEPIAAGMQSIAIFG